MEQAGLSLRRSARKALNRGSIANINAFEYRRYSQNGEDGILDIIFHTIGATNRFFVELGVGDGSECNTRNLRERGGWQGLMVDCADSGNPLVTREFVTAEDINSLFQKYSVPDAFDLLSVDIDSNDYWVWKALTGYSPRVVVIEYNASHSPAEARVVEYDPEYTWDGTDYFGASLLALAQLGAYKGYTLVGCDSNGVNAFFVRTDLVEGRFEAKCVDELYRRPGYGEKIDGLYIGHPHSDREMQTVAAP